VHGIVGQAGGVVAVGVAADQPEDALPHQLDHVVLDLARLPSVPQAAGDGFGNPQLAIERLEQHGPAVGAGVLGVELGHHKLVELEAELRIQSVAIEPPCRRAQSRLVNALFAHFRDSMAVFFHPSRIKRARIHGARAITPFLVRLSSRPGLGG
jgi:hypothetical protein